MSNDTNLRLLERAQELEEEITNHPSGYDKLLRQYIESGDLEALYSLVSKIEAELSQEHFAKYDLMVF